MNAGMEIVCLQHVAFEGPGRLESWLKSKGIKVRSILLSEEPLPKPLDCRAVIVMGGPMNIYQHRDHPWLVEEKAFIQECLERGIPLLGICLGAQLLADALGARVYQNEEREIGWYPIRLSPEICEAYPQMPEELKVLHWHGDTFELPAGVIRLASSEACSEQGFLIPGKCLALQFHPEATTASLDALIKHCGDELVPARYVQSREELQADTYDHDFSGWGPLLESILLNK